MSKESRLLPPAEERESDSQFTPEAARSATILMFVFGCLTIMALLVAGDLFFSSFTAPDPRIPGILWRLAFFGTLSAVCTLGIHNWLKTNKSSEPDSEAHMG